MVDRSRIDALFYIFCASNPEDDFCQPPGSATTVAEYPRVVSIQLEIEEDGCGTLLLLGVRITLVCCAWISSLVFVDY